MIKEFYHVSLFANKGTNEFNHLLGSIFNLKMRPLSNKLLEFDTAKFVSAVFNKALLKFEWKKILKYIDK